jgi:nitrogen-specific signal transduction histidine kinase
MMGRSSSQLAETRLPDSAQSSSTALQLATVAKRDVPIEYQFQESLPAIDLSQVQQVFINLIVNAIEAKGGQLAAPVVVLRPVTDSNRMLIPDDR